MNDSTRPDLETMVVEGMRKAESDAISAMGKRIADLERTMHIIAEAGPEVDVRRIAGESLGWTYPD